MNFNYLYLDEKSISYTNLLQKVLMNGEGDDKDKDNLNGNGIGEYNSNTNYENFMGYDTTSKKTYYDVKKK